MRTTSEPNPPFLIVTDVGNTIELYADSHWFLFADGQEAVDYLAGKVVIDRNAHPLPVLILLDLKMPRMIGFDVLAWRPTQREFKSIPVVVLSSSSDDSEIKKARQLGACDYFVKPHCLDEFMKIVHRIQARSLNTPALDLKINTAALA